MTSHLSHGEDGITMTIKFKAKMKYLLIILALLAGVWLMPQPAPYRLEVAPGGMERIEARLKWHGVESAVCDQKGCWFVDKKGRFCRL